MGAAETVAVLFLSAGAFVVGCALLVMRTAAKRKGAPSLKVASSVEMTEPLESHRGAPAAAISATNPMAERHGSVEVDMGEVY